MNDESLKNIVNKCLGCANPRCSLGCPLNMEIPQIIKLVKEGDLEGAYRKILSKSYFGSVCSRVCPHDQQCEGECVRGISSLPVKISEIEMALSDWGMKNVDEEMPPVTLEKVALLGGGPAGLTCAIELRKMGYAVTIFERESKLGGILSYGIPEYRLPNKIVDSVIENIIKHEIEVKTNQTLGIDFDFDDLKNQGFEAVFLGIGNDMSKLLNVEGIYIQGVYGANDFLKNIDSIKFDRVVVIGGGNVAMDVARMAKFKGAVDVTVVYRKQKIMMKANKLEVEHAEKEGIKFKFEALPDAIVGGTSVDGIICNDGETILADTVVMAIGSLPNYELLDNDIELSEDSLIKVSENGETSISGLFAGGDIVERRSTVCLAVKTARNAAMGINQKLKEKREALV